jgi:hypothetical protein
MLFKFTPLKSLILAAAILVSSGVSAFAHDYKIRITNMMSDELIAPIVVTSTYADKHIFSGEYVTPAAETQILTGDPAQLMGELGKKSKVVHGTDGPPGVLLAPGKSVEVTVKGRKRHGLRVIAMVAPTKTKDHFVSGVVNLSSKLPITLDRYDIGHDEGRKTIEHVSGAAAKVEIIRVDDKHSSDN